MNEIKDKLLEGHEVEFTLNGVEYTLELDKSKGLPVARIWRNTQKYSECISVTPLNKDEDIENVFKDTCFSGKSFLESEQDIIVETIY